jgi:hypothetical protein
MNRSVRYGAFLAFQVVTIVFVVGGSSDAGKGKDKKNPEPGTVAAKWDWTITDQSDKLVEKGSFTVRGYVLYHNGKQIGTYDDVLENKIKVMMTHGPLKGTLNLTRKETSPNWSGILERESGGNYNISVVFDRPRK